jgi:hypothetical protein
MVDIINFFQNSLKIIALGAINSNKSSFCETFRSTYKQVIFLINQVCNIKIKPIFYSKGGEK